MKILVTGAAGYIGSHMVKSLLAQKHHVVALDDFSSGHKSALATAGNPQLYEIDIADYRALRQVFESHQFDAVFHFASYIQVGESVLHPKRYYKNNFSSTLNLLQLMVENGVKNFVFSSSAAVYGTPSYTPIDEHHPKEPINPYGSSKWFVEQALQDFDRAYGLKSVCLRYFNAAGADPSGLLGERHFPETHLIPLVLQAASGRRDSVTVFGRDYETPDGTCIRDYVHVADLVSAHALALDYLIAGEKSNAFNLGTENGYSVQEVIEKAREQTGREIAVVDSERRPGDPARLIADARLAKAILGWTPRYSDLETIVKHAWAWEQKWPWH